MIRKLLVATFKAVTVEWQMQQVDFSRLIWNWQWESQFFSEKRLLFKSLTAKARWEVSYWGLCGKGRGLFILICQNTVCVFAAEIVVSWREELTRRKKTIELTRSLKNLEWIQSKLQVEIFVLNRRLWNSRKVLECSTKCHKSVGDSRGNSCLMLSKFSIKWKVRQKGFSSK